MSNPQYNSLWTGFPRSPWTGKNRKQACLDASESPNECLRLKFGRNVWIFNFMTSSVFLYFQWKLILQLLVSLRDLQMSSSWADCQGWEKSTFYSSRKYISTLSPHGGTTESLRGVVAGGVWTIHCHKRQMGWIGWTYSGMKDIPTV